VWRLRKQIGTVDSNANSTGLKAAFDLSIRCFQRSVYTYGKPFWPVPVVQRGFLQNRRVWRMRKRIGTVDSDANSTGLKAALYLSIWHFQRSFYTYKRLFLPAPVARRCILGNRSPGGCGCDLVLQWRCTFHSIECSVRGINMALSAKLSYV
jgi:hypothetical protein